MCFDSTRASCATMPCVCGWCNSSNTYVPIDNNMCTVHRNDAARHKSIVEGIVAMILALSLALGVGLCVYYGSSKRRRRSTHAALLVTEYEGD